MRRSNWFVLFFLATFAPFALADMGTVGMTLLKSAAGAFASGVVGSIFGSNKSAAPAAPAAPAIEKPTPMPTVDDEANSKAKKKSIVAMMQRQGRASTIMTGDTEAMG